MADHPFTLEPALAERLSDHLDRESKIARVLDDLGPLDGRDVAVVGSSPRWERELAALGSRVRVVPSAAETGLPDGSVDAVVSLWSAFPGPVPAEIAEAERILRPGGRILVLHDYGRDDVSRLRPTDLPEYGAWSRRNGPFLAGGWRIRVVHAWWSFESTDEARDLLTTAFGPAGEEAAATLRRPRMSYNVAIYHRTKESATS